MRQTEQSRGTWQFVSSVVLLAGWAGLLTALVCLHRTDSTDRAILLNVHTLSSSSLHPLALLFTVLGGLGGMIPLTGVLAYKAPRCRSPWRHQDFWITLALTFGAYAMSTLVKLLVHRPRPHLWKVLTPETDFSYPSGHALISLTVVTTAIWLAWPTRWRRAVLVAGVCFLVLVGFSRLYLGVHYPSDIIGGWLMGAAWVGGVLLIARSGRASVERLQK